MIKLKCIVALSLLLLLFFSNTAVFAIGTTCGKDQVCIDNPLGKSIDDAKGNPDVNILIGKIINAVLGVVGSLALVMFIYGGFTWMLAAGNTDRVQRGKNILIWATIGLVVIFSAYAIVLFVFQGLGVPDA